MPEWFFDMMVAQSLTGELEVLPGKSANTHDGNWQRFLLEGLARKAAEENALKLRDV